MLDGEAPEATERARTSLWTGDGPDLSPPSDEPLVGGKYRLLDPLGQGGTARVYRARHVALGRDFALKVIDPQAEVPLQMHRVFQREARMTSQLDHPNIIQVFDFGVDPEHGAYLVMELLHGETLSERLVRSGRLRPPSVIELTLQIAEALRYLHAQGIVHGDIKTENLFLCRLPGEGRSRFSVKLIDFGMARPQVSGLRLAGSEIGGTAQYIAPELLRHYPPQPAMDTYSLGVLMYEMLTGETPFDGTVQEILQAHLHHAPAPPSSLLQTPLPSRLEALVMACLDKDPAARPPSMENVLYQLRTISKMGGIGEERAPSPGGPAAPAPDPGGFQQVGEACPCPMFTISDAGTIAWANAACSALLRTPPEELQGKKAEETLLGAILPGLRDDIQHGLAGSPGAPVERSTTIGSSSGRTAWTFWLYPLPGPARSGVRLAGLLHPSR
jgi:serine/threonine-protein kinase